MVADYHGLCHNCLYAIHPARPCSAGNCHNCNEPHNSVLCPRNGAGSLNQRQERPQLRTPTNPSSGSTLPTPERGQQGQNPQNTEKGKIPVDDRTAETQSEDTIRTPNPVVDAETQPPLTKVRTRKNHDQSESPPPAKKTHRSKRCDDQKKADREAKRAARADKKLKKMEAKAERRRARAAKREQNQEDDSQQDDSVERSRSRQTAEEEGAVLPNWSPAKPLRNWYEETCRELNLNGTVDDGDGAAPVENVNQDLPGGLANQAPTERSASECSDADEEMMNEEELLRGESDDELQLNDPTIERWLDGSEGHPTVTYMDQNGPLAVGLAPPLQLMEILEGATAQSVVKEADTQSH